MRCDAMRCDAMRCDAAGEFGAVQGEVGETGPGGAAARRLATGGRLERGRGAGTAGPHPTTRGSSTACVGHDPASAEVGPKGETDATSPYSGGKRLPGPANRARMAFRSTKGPLGGATAGPGRPKTPERGRSREKGSAP